MKKFLKAMLACTLALVMVFALVSCDLFDKDDDKDDKDDKKSSVDMDDIEEAIENYAEEHQNEYIFSDMKALVGKKPVECGLEAFVELTGNVSSCFEFSSSDFDDETDWCLIIEFSKTTDAKNVAKDIEANLEEFYFNMMHETYKSMYGNMYEEREDIRNMVVSDSRAAAEDAVPESFSVQRIENVIFFGNASVVDIVFNVAEEAVK